jgi:hypothetical protein
VGDEVFGLVLVDPSWNPSIVFVSRETMMLHDAENGRVAVRREAL